MPLFVYECGACRERFEALVRADEPPRCPRCGRGDRLEKQLASFAVSTGSARPSAGAELPAGCGRCGDPRGPGACGTG